MMANFGGVTYTPMQPILQQVAVHENRNTEFCTKIQLPEYLLEDIPPFIHCCVMLNLSANHYHNKLLPCFVNAMHIQINGSVTLSTYSRYWSR